MREWVESLCLLMAGDACCLLCMLFIFYMSEWTLVCASGGVGIM